MKAVETAMTIGPSAFARHGSLSPGLMVARVVWTSLLNYQLVGFLAVCLLAASTTKVWGQLCVCAEPGMMNCALGGFRSHEPATSAFPQCLARTRRAAPPRPTVERGAARRQPPQRGGINPQPAVNAPPPAQFQPNLADQIQPLNCPRNFIRTGQTFYGGTRCAPIPMPSPAAGIQLPEEPPDAAATPPESQPPAQPIFSDTEPLSGPSGPPQLGEVPPPSQFNNTQAGVLANANWLDIMSAGTGLSKPTVRAFAVAGALAATVGFGGGAMLMPLLKAWP